MKLVKLTISAFLLLLFCIPLYAAPSQKPLVFSTAEHTSNAINAYLQLLEKAYEKLYEPYQ